MPPLRSKWGFMRLRNAICASALLFATTSCAARAASSTSEAEVVRVIDGDTIVVERDGVTEKCRLLGIDTPELSYGSMLAGLDRLAAHASVSERPELEAAIAVIRRHTTLAKLRARNACTPPGNDRTRKRSAKCPCDQLPSPKHAPI
jgi:endonuclease YncB( thermonuclease family)